MFITAFKPDRVDSSAEFSLGTIGAAFESNGAFRMYKYVEYVPGTGNLTLVAGDVVVYTEGGHASNQVTADVSDVAGSEIGAGVVQAAVSATTSYMWVQIKGRATVAQTIGGTPGNGTPLTCTGAADKALTLATVSTTNVTVVAISVNAATRVVACDFPY